MFGAVIFFREESTCVALENLAIESKQVVFHRILGRYPQAFELAMILNTHTPDLIFLDLSDWESALATASDIYAAAPHAAIIGFGGGWEPQRQAQAEAAGITEVLISPVTLKTFEQSVDSAIHKVRSAEQENLFVFLPAKAGSGSSTVALNLAGYLSSPPLSHKTLLIDGDLNSGLVSVALGIKHPYSVLDALENSAQLDYSYWMKCVASAGQLDALLSDRTKRSVLPSWTNYHHLLDFAASRYEHILVDLPEVVYDATVEIVRRARRVFIVCTPETASLALAPQRCRELERRSIRSEKIGVLLNRWHRGEPAAKEVERLLGCPVSAVFANDYNTVRNASVNHSFVNPVSKLGQSYAAFARALAGIPEPEGFRLPFLRSPNPKQPQPDI